MKARDTFEYLLRHGSETALLIERQACAATGGPAMTARIIAIDTRLAALRGPKKAGDSHD